MAAVVTDLKDELRNIGWLNSTTVKWTAEGYETICNNINCKRLSPEAVQIARRRELEFMDKLSVLKEVLVQQCWSETNAKPIVTKWIDINKGDVCRSRCSQVKACGNRTEGFIKSRWAFCVTTSSVRHRCWMPCDS